MRPSELQGKSVVGTGAKILGSVSDVEIDLASWKVTHLRIQLADEATEMLGYKKRFLGSVEILLSIKAVRAVADVVSLTNTIAELKDSVELQKQAST
jgi:sporulation protein YlmC with PRC-barrel domain